MIYNANMPKHIAIIMDGNGRWAKQRGLLRSDGHKAGVKSAKAIVTRARELELAYLTLYAFSTENWGRPQDEVGLLFQLLVEFLATELSEMKNQAIRLNVYGDISKLPFAARKALERAMSQTKNCDKMVVNLALNYSGQGEILRAVKNLLAQGLKASEFDENIFRSQLFSNDQPDPDLIIRTSGELRLSNFLTFQSAYSELYFTDILWPDFGALEFDAAILEYAKRNRRFGLTQEQIDI